MSSPQVQEWRKGETIVLAAEAIKGPKPDTQGLIEALEEPLPSGENKLAAIVAELVESVGLKVIQRGEASPSGAAPGRAGSQRSPLTGTPGIHGRGDRRDRTGPTCLRLRGDTERYAREHLALDGRLPLREALREAAALGRILEERRETATNPEYPV
jgi:hypothetical protein